MKQSSSALAVKSFAKINLYLKILSKRKDNFHNLSTLFCRIDLADTVTLKNRKDGLIRIKCASPHVPCDETNLCWRAAELLRQEFGLDFGLDIELKKRIPVGAGLGGGSSNAASVLLGLNKYWDLNLSREKLVNLGAKLGSDVPFFIYNTKLALGSGRGDKIRPLPSLDKLKLWFILIYPNIKVSTPLIYQKFDTCLPAGKAFSELTRPHCNVNILTSELSKRGKEVDSDCLFNDLEIVTSSLYPVVNQVKNTLYGMGLEKIIMSGSGSAVFAICNDLQQARDLRSKLVKKHKSWAVFVSSTI
ncbi:MAG: 4-(cytidine 5'-diphospho)-2-C-methyl-D-erythritol kinase [Candidatus Omnitrophota bacterium]|nr:4-(cytidine 5'-diphospho)-2-C-methyl-D-erythritol kinase [Candidatus Omnitrophota bacterium]